MGFFHRVSSFIDGLNRQILSLASWLCLFMVLVQFFVVVMRYVFGTGSIQFQEIILYMHGILFMVAAAGTLLTNDHVRVDIIYSNLSPRKQAAVELIGCILFLLPFCGLVLYTSWNYVGQSWQIMEGSREPGGLQGVYLLKSFIPLFAILLGLQGISQSIKALAILNNTSDDGSAPAWK
ncbi:MAG: C4-dicarboxylate ABC transporter permease [Rhizobiales bacterium TMED249]|mgnify:FL=1|uniref:TRAP transporter small permease protein n=1 Tax=PS1 clade bacterium TaxID=2175152 RepID=A0A368E291_9PROT|nr:MAG: C4-dicarboxylate ABC transporter permease [Rhizobiales bacterium TMED249]RCL77571.1 MAG: C4-dicarboxylate ABC transporter permease [PS1 clade bacterium]HAK99165.1 C4-dicarboxylate ABC transporter permease [Rhodobiaceae bacterium]HCV48844.1 C4-dicarboxylate ABC transporter permease [Rhodobiaceae bacterium]|tara:strand:- start:1942 stop:2478 length:537 start_codon:yes stop_codon:yes gene_type:complete